LDASPPQPYGSSIPVSKATADEVLLAWTMNGEPLPAAHGAPVRVVVPGYIGARSVKWVSRVTAIPGPSENYFQAIAYRLPITLPAANTSPGHGDQAMESVALNCDILSPDEGDVLAPGPTTVSGYALSGDGLGILRVEVSRDGGHIWHPATIEDELGPWAWRHWEAIVELPAGPAQILARAWDTSGATQPESAEQLWNPKGYMNNSWAGVRVIVSGG
nr:molybdopterin-dependent oxidoreductase [Geodermatophilaceae bacterium]